MPTLPDIKGKVVLDDSQLSKAAGTASKTGEAIKAGMQKGTTHTLRFTESLTTMLGHFGNVPPVVNQAARSIESMSSNAAKGMSAAQIAVGGVVAGLGLALGVGLESIRTYESLAEKVENYRRVVGGSAEEDGRMVQTFHALGVESDAAAQSMFRLSKAIETTPAKLESVGIVIARDSKGNTDLSKTLFNVADAYNATGDQAKRNVILFDAFGRSGREMIPVLEQGSAALKRLNDEARLTFTDADLERAKQMKIKQNEVNQVWTDMWATLGQKLLPAQEAFADSVLRGDYVQQRLSEDLKAGRITQDEISASTLGYTNRVTDLTTQYGKQYDASRKVKEVTDAQAQAANDAAAAAQKQVEAETKLVQEQEARINSAYALKLADLAVKENAIHLREALDKVAIAHDKVQTAQFNADRVAAKSGKNTQEYRNALDQLRKAQDDLTLAQDDVSKTSIQNEKNILAAAAAARKLQEDTDIATTGQRDAAKETQVYVDKLYAEAQTLAPGSELRKNIDGLIHDLGAVPTQITTKFYLETIGTVPKPGSKRAARELGYAAGGHPPTNVPSWVGEHGPELFTPDVPGTITPAGGIPPPPTPGGGDHLSVVVNAKTDASPQEIAADGAWELRRMRRTY